MKQFLILSVFFLAAICSREEDIVPPGEMWILDNVVCFCFFGDDYDFSTHSIRFDSGPNTVFIQNDGDNEFLAPTGSYPYSIDGTVITIEGRQYEYLEEGNTLTLTYVDEPLIADDEITYYYIRN
ncbi:hypothetical protein [Flagellimonas meishanensis]|uniref:hypothetical protein n=1 Tax=Flagellimonas meishanensis TaxID=2873264 RepID=UPI001CA6B1FA|nr:hypothetical protein [[Muricauda] meishanensis]